MSIVTIVGTSGVAIQVSVDGSRAQTLAEAYARQMSGALEQSRLQTNMLTEGSSVRPSSSGSLLQGFVTTGGSYAPQGTYDFIGVGALNAGGTSVLDQPVTIDGTNLYNPGSLSIVNGSTAGLTYKAGNGDGEFVGLAGNNYFNGGNRTGNWTIVTAGGNNTVLATNGINDIKAGGGRNLITLQQGKNTVLSEGEDTITGTQGGKTLLTITGGNARVTLQDGAFVSDQASIGSHITLGNLGSVEGGQGSTVIFSGASGTITNAHNDTISAAGDLIIDKGSNHTASVVGTLKFIAGTGNTHISAEMATLWGADGLMADINISKLGLWAGNQNPASSDQLIDASSSRGSLEAWTGAGNQTIIGGQGPNHIVFGTRFGTTTGASNATVTGGSSAANTFGVLAGHSAGDITITDFSAVKNNVFFMYNYKPVNAAEAVKALLSTSTVQGGNTSIMLDNNMRVTFLGVTDLKSSSIVIS